MKHIKTASQAETSMRDLYKTVTDPEPVAAEGTHIQLIEDIIEKTRKMDLLKLEISESIGKLMGYMQGHSSLKDDKNRIRIIWENASNKEVIDYNGLLLELNVPPATVAKYKTTKPGSRVFKILD